MSPGAHDSGKQPAHRSRVEFPRRRPGALTGWLGLVLVGLAVFCGGLLVGLLLSGLLA